MFSSLQVEDCAELRVSDKSYASDPPSAGGPHRVRGRSKVRINTFGNRHEHAIGGEHILLAMVLDLEIGDAAGEEININDFALGCVELHFLFQLSLFRCV
jgi:hypothetical protein